MNKRHLIIAFALASVLAGCMTQTQYDRYKAGLPLQNFAYKAGTTPAVVQRDQTNCQVFAAQQVPANQVVSTTPVISSPTQTYCNQIGTQTFCNTTGGQTFGGQVTTTDTNAGLRQRVFGQCMADKGYRYVNIPTCPEGVALDTADTLLPLSRTTCYRMTPDGRGTIGNY